MLRYLAAREPAPATGSGTAARGSPPGGIDARYLAELVGRAGGPVVHVARDAARLAAMRASLRFLVPELPTVAFPARQDQGTRA
jgi:transcription-repair coupling factor (superfamily II helicase)